MFNFRSWIRRLLGCPAVALRAGVRRRARTEQRPNAARLRVEQLEVRLVPANYLVTNTSDSGAGSLRQAILDANANAGADTIQFSIGTQGSQQTISPTSALPSLTDQVTIDGWTQGGSG